MIPIARHAWRLLVVLPLLMVGCQGLVCGCDIPITRLIVGTVKTAANAPVPAAVVSGHVARPSTACNQQTAETSDQTSTDGTGGFRLVLGLFGPVDSACVYVRVEPPPGVGLRDTLVGPIRVPFRVDRDSTVLTVVLSP